MELTDRYPVRKTRPRCTIMVLRVSSVSVGTEGEKKPGWRGANRLPQTKRCREGERKNLLPRYESAGGYQNRRIKGGGGKRANSGAHSGSQKKGQAGSRRYKKRLQTQRSSKLAREGGRDKSNIT